MDPAEAKARLARCLRRDAELHVNAPERIGEEFDRLDAGVPRDDPDIAIAIAFWDAWIDERNHDFPCFYDGIAFADWPLLANQIAAALTSGVTVEDSRVSRHFGRTAR